MKSATEIHEIFNYWESLCIKVCKYDLLEIIRRIKNDVLEEKTEY